MEKLKKILLDHTLFIVLVSAFGGSVVAMLFYLQFFHQSKEVPVQDIMEEQWYRPTVSSPLTLHAGGFSEQQLLELRVAAWVWQDSTGGRADIRIVPWEPDQPFSEAAYKSHEKYTIWLLDGNDKEVALLWAKYSIKMGGCSVGRFIGIMRDEAPENFSVIAAHEMGHMLGLEHIKPEYPAMMNIKTVRYVTKWDLLQFDYLYP